MKNTEKLKLFLDKEVAVASNIYQTEMLEHLKTESIAEEICKMTEIFKKILEISEENGRLKEVQYLQISLMRSKALMQESFYILEAYNGRYFLDEPIAEVKLDLPWIYEGYARFCESVNEGRKRYVQTIGNMELSRIKMTELYTCNKILKYLFRNSMLQIINLAEFEKLRLEDEIQIHIGDYRGAYEILFRTNENTLLIGRKAYEILQNHRKAE